MYINSTIYNIFKGGISYSPVDCVADFQPKCAGDDTFNVNTSHLQDIDMCKVLSNLLERYGKKPTDLVVGDELAVFLVPTWSVVDSIGVDIINNETGFVFNIVAASIKSVPLYLTLYTKS